MSLQIFGPPEKSATRSPKIGWGMGGSEAVWKFSKKSSNLFQYVAPYSKTYKKDNVENEDNADNADIEDIRTIKIMVTMRTKTLREHTERVILEICDLCDTDHISDK